MVRQKQGPSWAQTSYPWASASLTLFLRVWDEQAVLPSPLHILPHLSKSLWDLSLFSPREPTTHSRCMQPSPTSSTTPRLSSPTAFPLPSTRRLLLPPGPTVWPWAWWLAPPWQCQQVRVASVSVSFTGTQGRVENMVMQLIIAQHGGSGNTLICPEG